MDFKNRINISSVCLLVGVGLFTAMASARTLEQQQSLEDKLTNSSNAIALSADVAKKMNQLKASSQPWDPVRKSFDLGGDWKNRLRSLKSGGGGGVDGGGGNISGGEIFDSYQNSGLVKLYSGTLRGMAEQFYGERLQSLEQNLPGFKQWLYSGFSIAWYADDKPFAEDVCLNQSVYKASHQIVACQTWTSVKLQKSWLAAPIPRQSSYAMGLVYESLYGSSSEVSTEDSGSVENIFENPTSSAIIIHELIRFQVIRLARELNLSRLDQDDMVAQVTAAILNPSVSAQDVYELLVRTSLLPSVDQFEQQRHSDMEKIQQDMYQNLKQLQGVIQECARGGMEPNGYQYLMSRYVEDGKSCSQMAATADEKSLCVIQPNLRLLQEQHQKYCHKK